jgi:ribonuclease HII
MASIIAKVERDREMIKLHKKYPKYNFAKHKGYGTLEHRNLIKKHGPSSIHRKTFLKKILGYLKCNPKRTY